VKLGRYFRVYNIKPVFSVRQLVAITFFSIE
jgi:hypothetical protein